MPQEPPTAEIIAAGTELTSGQKLDTNSQWLAARLRESGVDVRFHTVVGDSIDDNMSVLRVASDRCDIVIMTGGLGPTLDDITREAISAVVDQPLVLDESALSDLEAFFAGRSRVMPERNRTQAMRPKSAEMLKNEFGTAPGILARRTNESGHCALIAALPGVPSEMRPMFLSQVAPRLPIVQSHHCLRLIHCYGLGESAVEEQLGELTARGRNPEVGITASSATITLRILARGVSIAECERLADSDEASIRSTLGSYVFGTADDTLESVVVGSLRSRSLSLATAESGTAGAIARAIASVPQSESVYLGGLIAPAAGDDELLNEPPPDDPFSADRAVYLANAVRERLKSDVGLAAVCDPSHLVIDTATAHGALAHVAVSTPDGSWSVPINLLGNPAIHSARIAKTALNSLRIKALLDE